MYTQHQLCIQELREFAAHLSRLQEMIIFYHQQQQRGQTPDPEPILKLVNALADLYS